MSSVTYKVLIEYKDENKLSVSRWLNIDIRLDQKSKSKTKNRSRAAEVAKQMYPGCTINQITFN